jgi:predicted metalloprotease with PDZ domain
MKYRIQTKAPQQQYLQITAEFEVNQAVVTLQFPTWRPGRYELGNFAKNVRSFKVSNELGKPIKFEKTSKDQWQVETTGASKVLVEYEYYSAELNAGSTFLDDKRVYVNPVNCLVYIPGRESEPCSLEIELFQELKYSGTLPLDGNKIQAKSYHELVDSPFIFCDDVESNHYQYGGVEFKISFVGVQNVPWERVLSDFQKFTKKQFDDFGAFPVNSFHFIVIVTPYPHYHGVEHLASTIIVLGPTPEIFGALYDELLGVSSHELYHVWNVKSIRSVDIYPYDYSRENFSRMGYLCEGITTYLGDYYLMASGIWTPEKYFKEFSQVIQKHLDNAGRFNYSLAESSWDTWLDGYVPGAPSRKVSIYNEGAIFALITDVFIRKNSKSKHSIASLMKRLYEDFYCQSRGVSEADFIRIVSELSEADYNDLFGKLVYQRISFEDELKSALDELGLELFFSANPDPISRLLGIKTVVEQNAHKIASILPDSISDKNGLMLGDRIWSLNGQVVRTDFALWLNYCKNENLVLNMDRAGRAIQIDLPKAEIEYFNLAQIRLKDSASDKTVFMRSSWTCIQEK